MIQRLIFENKTYVHVLVIFVVCYFAFFLASNSFFVNIMEARNFVTAREIIEKGNWLVPSMNGELRLAKPPFPTWITALFGAWFGIENLTMLRFPAGIMSSIMIVFMYLFTLSLNKNRIAALSNSLILASSFYVVYMGRTGTWDIYCHSFMLGAIWLLHKAWKTEKENWTLFAGAGVLMGLSFLSKGPVAFFAVLIPFILAYSWTYGGKIILKKWKPLSVSLLIFVIISFWWPIYIYLAHAEEAAAVAQLESGSWINRHVRPFYYYWNFPIQSGIWTLFITTALIFPFVSKRFENKSEYKFALIWTLSSVVLLSLLPEKKDRYLLPVLIPSALLAGQLVQYFYHKFKNKTADKLDRIVMGTNVWLLALVAFALPVGVFFIFYREDQMSLINFICLSLFSEGLFILFVWAWKKKSILAMVFGVVALMAIAEAFIIPNTQGLLNKNPNFKNLGELKQNPKVNTLNYYSIDTVEFRIELVYEVGKEVKKWNPQINPELPEKGPFVVFSSIKTEDVFSEDQLQELEIIPIDFFDYNRYHKSKKRNKPYFQKYVAIVKSKSE